MAWIKFVWIQSLLSEFKVQICITISFEICWPLVKVFNTKVALNILNSPPLEFFFIFFWGPYVFSSNFILLLSWLKIEKTIFGFLISLAGRTHQPVDPIHKPKSICYRRPLQMSREISHQTTAALLSAVIPGAHHCQQAFWPLAAACRLSHVCPLGIEPSHRACADRLHHYHLACLIATWPPLQHHPDVMSHP
jgi:hypothetical protein